MSDRDALLCLYEATRGKGPRFELGWTDRGDWFRKENLKTFRFIEVDEGGHVKRIDVSENRLEDELPNDKRMLKLVNLEDFIVVRNMLYGIPPPILGQLQSLRRLHLAWNKFEGPFPECLLQLKRLKNLRLDHNLFHGPIPATITDLTEMEYLDLSYNNFDGFVPLEFRDKWTTLRYLDLSGNHFLSNSINNGEDSGPDPIPSSIVHYRQWVRERDERASMAQRDIESRQFEEFYWQCYLEGSAIRSVKVAAHIIGRINAKLVEARREAARLAADAIWAREKVIQWWVESEIESRALVVRTIDSISTKLIKAEVQVFEMARKDAEEQARLDADIHAVMQSHERIAMWKESHWEAVVNDSEEAEAEYNPWQGFEEALLAFHQKHKPEKDWTEVVPKMIAKCKDDDVKLKKLRQKVEKNFKDKVFWWAPPRTQMRIPTSLNRVATPTPTPRTPPITPWEGLENMTAYEWSEGRIGHGKASFLGTFPRAIVSNDGQPVSQFTTPRQVLPTPRVPSPASTPRGMEVEVRPENISRASFASHQSEEKSVEKNEDKNHGEYKDNEEKADNFKGENASTTPIDEPKSPACSSPPPLVPKLHLFKRDENGNLVFDQWSGLYEAVEAFYKENNPTKAHQVPLLWKKYQGKWHKLVRKLEEKYDRPVPWIKPVPPTPPPVPPPSEPKGPPVTWKVTPGGAEWKGDVLMEEMNLNRMNIGDQKIASHDGMYEGDKKVPVSAITFDDKVIRDDSITREVSDLKRDVNDDKFNVDSPMPDHTSVPEPISTLAGDFVETMLQDITRRQRPPTEAQTSTSTTSYHSNMAQDLVTGAVEDARRLVEQVTVGIKEKALVVIAQTSPRASREEREQILQNALEMTAHTEAELLIKRVLLDAQNAANAESDLQLQTDTQTAAARQAEKTTMKDPIDYASWLITECITSAVESFSVSTSISTVSDEK
jgi:hypothetical protein